MHEAIALTLELVFETEYDAELFFNYINPRLPNIHFTLEKEVDHKLAFLGVLIHNDSPHLKTNFFP